MCSGARMIGLLSLSNHPGGCDVFLESGAVARLMAMATRTLQASGGLLTEDVADDVRRALY